jgi:hypothetical protein
MEEEDEEEGRALGCDLLGCRVTRMKTGEVTHWASLKRPSSTIPGPRGVPTHLVRKPAELVGHLFGVIVTPLAVTR